MSAGLFVLNAEALIFSYTSSGVSVLFCIRTIAAAAETKGAEADVPVKLFVYPPPSLDVYTFVPGAAMSTVVP